MIGDEHTLQPDPFEMVVAADATGARRLQVFPYCTDDLVTCRRLLDAGCRMLMPWGAPIGSGQGLLNAFALRTLRERLPDTMLIVDAGIGAPSHAAQAMELGFDAVLLNTAVAQAQDPVAMAQAFRMAVEAGRIAWRSGDHRRAGLRDAQHAGGQRAGVARGRGVTLPASLDGALVACSPGELRERFGDAASSDASAMPALAHDCARPARARCASSVCPAPRAAASTGSTPNMRAAGCCRRGGHRVTLRPSPINGQPPWPKAS